MRESIIGVIKQKRKTVTREDPLRWDGWEHCIESELACSSMNTRILSRLGCVLFDVMSCDMGEVDGIG